MAAFYGRALGYQLSRDGEAIKAIADKRRLIFTPRPVKGLVSAGWALPDSDELRRLRARLSRAGLAHTDTADAAFTDGVRVADPSAARCGDVLKGVLSPPQCALFGKECTPERPVGALMVSSEGACAAHYRYVHAGQAVEA